MVAKSESAFHHQGTDGKFQWKSLDLCAHVSFPVHAHEMLESVPHLSIPSGLLALGSLQPEIADCHSHIGPGECMVVGNEELQWQLLGIVHRSPGLRTLWKSTIQILMNTLGELVGCTSTSDHVTSEWVLQRFRVYIRSQTSVHEDAASMHDTSCRCTRRRGPDQEAAS